VIHALDFGFGGGDESLCVCMCVFVYMRACLMVQRFAYLGIFLGNHCFWARIFILIDNPLLMF